MSSVKRNKAVKPDSATRTFLRLAGYISPYKTRAVWALVSIVLVAGFSVVSITVLLPVIQLIFGMEPQVPENLEPYLSWLYNWVDASDPMVSLVVVSVVFTTVTAVTGVFRYIQMYLMYWIGYRIALDLQHELFETMTRYHVGFFARSKVGELISYYTVDMRVVSIALFNMMGKIILDPFIILFSLIFLLFLSWRLTLLYAVTLPLLVWCIQYLARKNRRAGREAQDFTAGLNALVQEHFSNIRLVQGFEMYEHQSKRFHHEAMRVFRASMRMVKAISVSSPVNEMFGVAATCCVMILGGYFVLVQGELESENFILYVITLARLFQPIKRIERSIQDVQIGLAASERIFGALDQNAVLPAAETPVNLRSFEREIAFDHVQFAYDENEPVLHDFNLHVNKGEVVAFVGPSGAGKTTVVNLLPRFFDPTEGAVSIDGHDLREFDLSSLRKQMSIVTQEVMMMADSIRANITCGHEGYTDEQIQAAAYAAHAEEFIVQLPQKYDTVIGERGVGLSGGQRQRLALARAFLRDAPVLILDEATSALDSRSEQHVKDSIQKLMQGRTVFVIAHRLSTILHADKIVMMDHGRILDTGKHEELIQRCGLYQKLFHLQMSGGQQI